MTMIYENMEFSHGYDVISGPKGHFLPLKKFLDRPWCNMGDFWVFKSSEGRLIYITSVSSFCLSVVLGSFQTFSCRVLDGSSPNLACGLVLPPYCALLNAVPVGCTGVTHHWLWWLKTLVTEVSRPFLTELLMDHHQTWHVGCYCHPTEPYELAFRSDAQASRTIDFDG